VNCFVQLVDSPFDFCERHTMLDWDWLPFVQMAQRRARDSLTLLRRCEHRPTTLRPEASFVHNADLVLSLPVLIHAEIAAEKQLVIKVTIACDKRGCVVIEQFRG
jgi:hypothetical protein